MKSKTVFSNFIWRFAERCGAQLVSAIVSVILARLLMPADYGVVAMVTVFITVLNVFISNGLGNALIQKKNADDTDFSTVFYTNIVFCLTLYTLLFLASPLISRFYNRPEMTPMLRVLGLVLIISGVKNIQMAYVSRNMQFKRFFFATLGGTLASCVLSIAMAYWGYGIWALVALHLVGYTVNTAILWFTVEWRPGRLFSLRRLKGLLAYGWKLLAASFLDTVYLQLYPLLIGARFPKEELGQFDKGRNWPDQITQSINASIDGVLLPVLSAEQDDKHRVREMTRRAIKTSSYVMMPLMAGLAVCAEPLVHLLLGEEWMPCVPFLQIFCVIYAFYPLHTANLNAIKAMGRSDVFLALEILKKLVETGALLVTLRYGVFAMALGQLASSILAQIINAWPNRKLLDYPYLRQLLDLLPALLLSAAMGAAVWTVTRLGLRDILTLLIQVPMGAALYVLGSWLLKLESFTFLISTAKKMLHRSTEGEKHG